MGKCLSKQGQSKGDNTDKAPYSPSTKQEKPPPRREDSRTGQYPTEPVSSPQKADSSPRVAHVVPQKHPDKDGNETPEDEVRVTANVLFKVE